jgi:hypothetical protein
MNNGLAKRLTDNSAAGIECILIPLKLLLYNMFLPVSIKFVERD